MAQSYSWDHQTTSRDDQLTGANPSLLAVIHINEQSYLMLIKVTEFCTPPSSKLYI